MKQLIEGLLFVSGDEGITIKDLQKIIKVTHSEITETLNALIADYETHERGMTIVKDGLFYSLTTRAEHSPYYKEFFKTPQATRLSQAALETLAIIAYKQPITRTEIEEIRGVKSERPLQTLIARSLIEEVGRKDTIGRPILFGTTKEFLLFFGLKSIDELPELMEDLLTDLSTREEVNLFS